MSSSSSGKDGEGQEDPSFWNNDEANSSLIKDEENNGSPAPQDEKSSVRQRTTTENEEETPDARLRRRRGRSAAAVRTSMALGPQVVMNEDEQDEALDHFVRNDDDGEKTWTRIVAQKYLSKASILYYRAFVG